MSLVADTATLVHGYTMADVERYAGKAANQVGGMSAMVYEDKYEVAWFGVVEHLYERETRPTWRELMDAGRDAILRASNEEARQHGFDRLHGAGHVAPRFAVYWNTAQLSAGRGPATIRAKSNGHTDFTDHLIERMALPTALGALSGVQYEAVIALAVFETRAAAARALNIGEHTFSRRITAARAAFLEAWYAPETTPTSRVGRGSTAEAKANGTCRFGHSRDEHSIFTGRQVQCQVCRRNAKRRAKARETPEQREKRRAEDRERQARKLAAETPEQRDARNAAVRARRAEIRGATHVIE